jgi:hypothetical protein
MAREAEKSAKIMRAYQYAVTIVQARGGKPDVLDLLNDDEALRIILYAEGTPAEVINDPDQIEKIRQARMRQQKEMIREEQMAKAAKAVGQLGKVSTAEGKENIVSDLIDTAKGEDGGNAS